MSTKGLIIFTVMIDIIGVGVIIPVLPFYVESFGASDVIITALFSIFALLSFVSAPFLGALSDRFGRRPILIVSIASTALGWLIFAAARNVMWLFIGRIIDGLAAGNIGTAQSYLSDISQNETERSQNMGLIGAMFGIGLIVGPVLGGFLGTLSHTTPFWFVGVLATINAIIAWFKLPETHHNRSTEKVSWNPIIPIIRSLKNKKLVPLLSAWFLFSASIAVQMSIFSLYVYKVFGWQEIASGVVLGIMGVLLVINQTILLKKFWLKFFNQHTLNKIMYLVLAFGMLALSTPYIAFFIAGILLNTFAQAIIRTVTTSELSGIDPERRGENLGVMNSVMSLAMVVSPLVAGMLFEKSHALPYILASITACIAFVIMFFGFHTKTTQ